MTEQTKRHMNDYFREQLQLCARQQQALEQELRQDEAVFQRIRANVYDIFCTVLSAAEKAGRGDAAAEEAFFRQRLDRIPSAWQEALDRAQQHGDAVQMRLEQLKLDTAAEIRSTLDRLGRAAE